MALTVRTTENDDLVIEKLKQAFGENTASKALLRAAHEHIALQQENWELLASLIDLRKELKELKELFSRRAEIDARLSEMLST